MTDSGRSKHDGQRAGAVMYAMTKRANKAAVSLQLLMMQADKAELANIDAYQASRVEAPAN